MTLPNGLVSVVDLFSGAGGMSYGFMAHGAFEMIGAADARRRGGSVAYYGHPMARVCTSPKALTSANIPLTISPPSRPLLTAAPARPSVGKPRRKPWQISYIAEPDLHLALSSQQLRYLLPSTTFGRF